MTYSVEYATPADAYELCGLHQRFFMESNYRDMTFNPQKCLEFFQATIKHSDHAVLVAKSNGWIIGYFMFAFDAPFMDELIALFEYFYIQPEYRDGSCSQILLEKGLEICDTVGAKKVYASSTAGFTDNGVNERALNILLKRHGFKHVGSYLIRG